MKKINSKEWRMKRTGQTFGKMMIGLMALLTLVGCRKTKDSDRNVQLEPGDKYTYTTISELYDWGPAITKVIFYLGEPVDSSTVFPDDFTVSSVRAFNYDATPVSEDIKPSEVQTAQRKILDVFVSDETGKELSDGSYVTFVLEVKAGVADSSPLNYATYNGMCSYADTSYIIELSPGAKLKGTDGKRITFKPTDKAGYVANKNIIPDGFTYDGSYEQDGIELLYATFTPENAPSENGKTPLIIWLHGHGEGGHDATLAVLGNQIVKMGSSEIQAYFGETGAYLLIPQAPTFWMDYNGKGKYNNTVNGSQGRSVYTEPLMGLIETFAAEHPDVDKNRIYIGGMSNGGYMTMNMITTYPEYFAAAFPVCECFSNEWLTEQKLNSIVDMPIWFTHAKTDTTVPIYRTVFNKYGGSDVVKDENGEEIAYDSYTNAAYRRLVEAGAANVHYSLFDKVVDTTGMFFIEGTDEPYEYNGHFSWMPVLNNQCVDNINGEQVTIFDWISRQSRG